MPRILVVDDELTNLNALKRELMDRSHDWVVDIASSEDEAASLLLQHNFDAIITDLVMTADQSGMEVLRQAKLKDPLVMVILITAYEKSLDRYRAFEMGAFDCVQKNMPGIIAAEEIFFKTQAALRFRELALNQIKNEARLVFLRRYFDPRVFKLLEENPDLLNVRNKIITICFWDIRGFSKLCESLKAHPTLIAAFLREYFQIAAEVIFENQGVLDKYIGDGVMGLFGALEKSDDEGKQDATQAVTSALELRNRFDALLKKWTEQWVLYTPQVIEVGIGCGIHSGEVLVGNVGTDLRDQYTALGPTVNFTQRIEATSKEGQILISASTEARVRDQFRLEKTGVMEGMKNIAGEFALFSVLGRK